MSTSDTIKENLLLLRNNPASIQRYMVQMLEDASNGEIELKDPTNPFVFLLEAASMVGSTTMGHSEAVARRLYPVLAQEYDDLYRHMADNDYLDRFGVPSSAVISVIVPTKDIVENAVLTDSGQFRKLTIPRNSEFKVMDYIFGIHYPIDIRVMPHGGLQVVYDTDEPSPLRVIADNNIEWFNMVSGGVEYILINIPVSQFQLVDHYLPLNVKTGLVQELAFTDQFYFARVYNKLDRKWIEIGTTHSKEVFDTTKPTALLTVLDGTLKVTVPQVYFSNGQMGKELRVDVYTTRGELTLDLGGFTEDTYSIKWRDINKENKNKFTAPLGKLSNWSMFSESKVTGGSDGSSFETLRQRVIDARTKRDTPVTYNELKVALADRGYDLIKSIDNITDRVFHASRTIPSYNSSTTPASGMIGTVAFDDGILSSKYVVSHRDAHTVLPNFLYEMRDNKVRRLSDSDYEAIIALDPEDKADVTEQRNLLYVPCHYVLNERDGFLKVTPYLLTSPKMRSRRIRDENLSVGYRMISDAISIEHYVGGWKIAVRVRSSDDVKDLRDDQVHAQLSFIPKLENDRVYLNGTIIGTENGERIFEFDVASGFDIDSDDNVRLNGFSMFSGDISQYISSLVGDFNVTFALSDVGDIPEDDSFGLLRTGIGRHLLPSDAKGLTIEELGVELGQAMDLLLSKSRTSVSTIRYESYAADVPDTYVENIYRHDSHGVVVLTTDSNTGRRVPIIEHKAGTPKVDKDGNVILKHRKGDVKLVNGQPIPLNGRGLQRFADMLLIDARHLFTDDAEQKEYARSLPDLINDQLHGDLSEFTNRLLERTELLYVPKRSMGKVDIIVSDLETRSVDSAQVIDITFYQNALSYQDDDLNAALTATARTEVLKWLNNKTLSLAALTSNLREQAGNNAIGVSADWVGELSDLDTFTLVEDDASINIRQQLKLQYDNTVAVEDAINVDFILQTA